MRPASPAAALALATETIVGLWETGVTVVVRCAKVPAPVAVRYAWEYSPRVNLVNEDGLPAAPFQYRVER